MGACMVLQHTLAFFKEINWVREHPEVDQRLKDISHSSKEKKR